VSLVLFVVYSVYNLSVLIKYLWSKTVKLGIVSVWVLSYYWVVKSMLLILLCLLSAVEWKLQSEMRRCTNIWYISIQMQYAEVAILLHELGWRDHCQLLYHKWCCVWSSWWNTQSHAACCLTRDTQLDSVNIYFIFYGNSVAIELLTSDILGDFKFPLKPKLNLNSKFGFKPMLRLTLV